MRDVWRQAREMVVWTNGCFDLLHPGHIQNLAEARAQGDILIVGLNSDRSIGEIKGPDRPILNERFRVNMLAALEAVDYVLLFDEATPIAALEKLQPDVHCKGEDYADNIKPIPERETVERYGGRIHFLAFVPGVSTTGLIQKIREASGNQRVASSNSAAVTAQVPG